MRNLMMTCALCVLLAATALPQQKQTSKTKGPTTSNPVTTAEPATTKPAGQPPLEQRLVASVTDATSDPDDHVRCFFTKGQLADLRPEPAVAKLTEADQSRVLTAVVKVVEEASGTELTIAQKKDLISYFLQDIHGRLIDKTPGEALATVMTVLYDVQARALENNPYYTSALDPESLKTKVLSDTGNSDSVKRSFESNSTLFRQNDPLGNLEKAHRLLMNGPQDAKTESTSNNLAAGLSDAIAVTQLSGAAADQARAELNELVRPKDVGCAYQILSWKDSKFQFGRSVANEFIAVQVTIRNLNKQEEFIVHNAQLAVDTDINGAWGQYFESVDKLGVEAYNKAGEALTARGIVGNSISAATTILSALQPIVGVANFSNAVAAFNGGVPKGWASLEPDSQKDQLLLIANTGFSATDSLKTVVPKSSTATFFTWFPAKPFLEGWWVQNCAQDLVGPSGTTPPQVGVDKARAREACKTLTGKSVEEVPFQKWTLISDQLFRDLSMVVVAGMHVREDSKNSGALTDLKNCPKDGQGQLDLSKASSNGTISCDAVGQNLDKITKLRLENAGNLVDPARPEGVLSEVSSDNTGAKVAFSASDLAAAPGDAYNVFVVGKDGSETASAVKIYLEKKTVKVTKLDPSSLDLAKQPLDKLTLSGTNLDKLKSVCLLTGSGADSKKVSAAVSDASVTKATLDVNSAGLTQGTWTLYANDCTDSNKTTSTLSVTDTTPARPLAVKPKSSPKAPSRTPTGQSSPKHD